MRVRLLGTGAASGWPDPWCSCASCAAAATQGVVRGQTGALVDDRLLLDLGPELPRAALRQGVSLAAVEGVLVTHLHADHCAPATLRWRGYHELAPLRLAGPPPVLEACASLAHDGLELLPVAAGDRLTVAGYAVVVLPAAHGSAAVLYDVTGPDGSRLLYATDTGVLPEAALALASGRAYDAVLLELTNATSGSHLDLTTFPQQVQRLRSCGAVTDRTQLVAVHLGHGNPPPDILDALLGSWGCRAGRDGDLLSLGPDRVARGARVLVLGGARSGKSAHAERRVTDCAPVTYVATAPARPDDREWTARVAAHVARRPAAWRTVETGDLAQVLRQASGTVLVDDLGLWLVQVIDAAQAWEAPDDVFAAALGDLCHAWATSPADIVLVAPEVGSGVVPEHRSGRVFRDLLGTATAALAAQADEVVQVVAGIPRRLTGRS